MGWKMCFAKNGDYLGEDKINLSNF